MAEACLLSGIREDMDAEGVDDERCAQLRLEAGFGGCQAEGWDDGAVLGQLPACPRTMSVASGNAESLELMGRVAMSSFKAFLQVAFIASIGIYLSRKGVLTPAVVKALSNLSAKTTVPALLFVNVLNTVDTDILALAWPMMLLPIIHVAAGVAVGNIFVWFVRPPSDILNPCVAAVAFANSGGLAVVMLEVHQAVLKQWYPTSAQDCITFLSVYVIINPCLQWVFAFNLLRPKPPLSQQVEVPQQVLSNQVEQDSVSTVVSQTTSPMSQSASNDKAHLASTHLEGNDKIVTWLSAALSATHHQPESLTGIHLANIPPNDENLRRSSWVILSLAAKFRASMRERSAARGYDADPQQRYSELNAAADGEGIDGRSHSVNFVASQKVDSLWNSTVLGKYFTRAQLDLLRGGVHDLHLGSVHAWDLLQKSSLHLHIPRACVSFVWNRVLVPPVCGVLLGILCSCTPPLYFALCGGVYGKHLSQNQGDCPTNDASFSWLVTGLKKLGAASVPMSLLLLGSSLASGPDWTAMPPRVAFGIVIARMLIMPLVGIMAAILIGVMLSPPIALPWAPFFFLTAMVLSATPSASKLIVMTELAGANRSAMATCIFVQLLCAPFIMTIILSVFVMVAQELAETVAVSAADVANSASNGFISIPLIFADSTELENDDDELQLMLQSNNDDT